MISNSSNRSPWDDRWAQPRPEQLLAALKPHHRRHLESMIQYVDQLPGVERSLIWYGASWKWTFQVTIPGLPDDQNTLCYLVPNTAGLIVCVPLTDAVIDSLPKKRISKFIREGIRSAKRAVTIHWAIWAPTSDSDTHLLTDLIRRKHQFLVNEGQLAQR
jgi:hypothetical protein